MPFRFGGVDYWDGFTQQPLHFTGLHCLHYFHPKCRFIAIIRSSILPNLLSKECRNKVERLMESNNHKPEHSIRQELHLYNHYHLNPIHWHSLWRRSKIQRMKNNAKANALNEVSKCHPHFLIVTERRFVGVIVGWHIWHPHFKVIMKAVTETKTTKGKDWKRYLVRQVCRNETPLDFLGYDNEKLF